jgi:heptosyltransferase-2
VATLVVQTSFLGDMVLTTPLIATLAARGPVDVVGTPASIPLLANDPHVRRALAYDKRGAHRGLRGLAAVAWELRMAGAYEAAYLAQGSIRSAILARLAGSNELIGFNTSAGRFLYTRRIRYRDDVHHAERLWRLQAADDAPSPAIEILRPRLYPGNEDRERVAALLANPSFGGKPLLAIAPGSNWGTKRWPYYADLAARVAAHARTVVIGGAAEAPAAAAVLERAPDAIDATACLSLLAAAELIARSVALVCNDSAPLHFASAMNTPTLAIFGPTVPAFGFGPLSERHAIAGHHALPCRPCDRHGPRTCPLGHWRCMRELSPDEVYMELAKLVPEVFN